MTREEFDLAKSNIAYAVKLRQISENHGILLYTELVRKYYATRQT